VISFGCTHAERIPRDRPTATPLPSATATAVPTSDPPPAGLVDIDPSIIVRLRYDTADNFTGAPLPGYLANRGLLRPAAANDLRRAESALLERGYTLVVLDAYRPVRATLAMVAWAHRMHRDDLIGPFIAAHSEHNLGAAVDVTLAFRSSGRELDTGAPFDTFGAGAHYPNASGAALANRTLLRNAMIAAGFQPYDFEWWHFSVTVPGATPLDDVIR